MHRSVLVICLLHCFLIAWSQEEIPRYKLKPGEIYLITMELIQETETENTDLGENMTIDIDCTIEFQVESISSDGSFHFSCSYKNLAVSFFSPRAELYISSRNQDFSNLQYYLTELENRSFRLVISPYGELLEADSLNPIIESLIPGDTLNRKYHKLIIRTVREAFGSSALLGMVNTVINVYSKSPDTRSVKYTRISYNGSLLPVRKSLFYSMADEESMRIQGVGVIEETEDSFQNGRSVVQTSITGQQTYDLLYDRQTGWLITGLSKQRIHSLFSLKENNELPKGLKVPSLTVSEIKFTGSTSVKR